MAGSVNKVILIGNLGRDPEVRYTPSGQAVANFTVATNEAWTDKAGQKQERAEWHRVVVWGKTAENCGICAAAWSRSTLREIRLSCSASGGIRSPLM